MADGDSYLMDTDGEQLLDADGAEAIHEDCCCGGAEPGDDCEHCTEGRTPANYTVTPAGVTDCPGFGPDATGVNGLTFVCAQTVYNACAWLGSAVDGNGVTWDCGVQITGAGAIRVNIGTIVGVHIMTAYCAHDTFAGECNEIDQEIDSDITGCLSSPGCTAYPLCGTGGTAQVGAGP